MDFAIRSHRRSLDKQSSRIGPFEEIHHIMKTLKCDLCEYEAQGETFEEWMEALKPHYMDSHPEVMANPSNTKEDMEKWMADNRARFEAA